MVMGGGVTSHLGVVLSLDDRFSAPMAGVAARTRTAGQTFLAATPKLASFGSSMTGLLIATGALDSKMGSTVVKTLAFTSAFASAIPAIQALIPLISKLNVVLRTTAVVQALLLGMTGVGLGKVALGVGAAAVVGGALFAAGRMTADRPEPRSVTVVTNLDGRQIARTVSQYQERDRLVGRVSGSR